MSHISLKINFVKMSAEDEKYMQMAYREAESAFDEDEIPVGAVVVCNGMVIARSHNLTEMLNDVTAHAEMQAITAATNQLGGKYLNNCTMYVTLEPCVMCAGAIMHARIEKVFYGAKDEKRGALGGLFNLMEQKGFNHYFEINCLDKIECGQILKDYFKSKR